LEKLALISVSDKEKISELALALVDAGYTIIATGNSGKILREANIPVKEIKDVTGFEEIFDGRVKTLHPMIFGGILYRRGEEKDKEICKKFNIPDIDVVCVNLYPFKKTAENSSSTIDDIIENIDIGGPSLIRASAKNHKFVSVLTDPSQYDGFISELKKGGISDTTRRNLAVKAFAHTADYDTFISNFFEKKFDLPADEIRISFPKVKDLRYGENPHQKGALYGDFYTYFEVLHGKELSYNNILDLVSAVELVEDLGDSSAVIIKHNNPAGAATGDSLLDAYEKSLKSDPVSAFGGIVAFTGEVNKELAEKLNEIFLEVISAPSFSEEALKILMKKKDRRLLKQLKSIREGNIAFRSIPGGVILQDADYFSFQEGDLRVVTEKKPADDEMEDLKFAWIVAKHTKSNAIVFVKNKATLGVGAGQMSRIDSVKIAKMKAEEHGLNLSGSVAASDAFFPFADGLLEIIKCGATSVIQPGGSVRDPEVIEAANDKKISMVFTGIRHFKH
jgi:phosphoribosylaminoimidazolecarboxamide formyltransferase / IMP cyclohydrolase